MALRLTERCDGMLSCAWAELEKTYFRQGVSKNREHLLLLLRKSDKPSGFPCLGTSSLRFQTWDITLDTGSIHHKRNGDAVSQVLK